MKYVDWNKEMPEVPENVHAAVLGALEQIGEKEKIYRKKKISKRRIIVLAAATVAVLGTTAVVAKTFPWNPKAVEEFNNPTPELQEKMEEAGVAEEPNVSVTNGGITVTAVQTLRDENRIYLLLDLTSEEQVIDESVTWGNIEMITDENKDIMKDYHASGGGMFEKGNEEEMPAHQGYYWLSMTFGEGAVWTGDRLTLKLTDYKCVLGEVPGECGYTEGTPYTVEGCWELDIPLKNVQEMTQTFELNKEYLLSGQPVKINKVTVSPLTLTIYYDKESLDKMAAAVYGDEADIWIQETFPGGLMDAAGNWLCAGYGGTGGVHTEDEVILQVNLNSVVDVDEVHTLVLGQEEVQVDLR